MPQEFSAGSNPVIAHYDELAPRYDRERFESSYGRYVHAQEHRLLRRWLPPLEAGPILDLGCGTGRLLEFATHGLDGSAQMVAVARQKHPGKVIWEGRLERLDELGLRFAAIFCLHVFMHLRPELVAQIVSGCWAQLAPGGVFVFDIPSRPRRRLTGFRPQGWHARNDLDRRGVATLLDGRWTVTHWRGVLFLPIHRLPHGLRPLLRPLDDLASATPLKRWASYWMLRLLKQP